MPALRVLDIQILVDVLNKVDTHSKIPNLKLTLLIKIGVLLFFDPIYWYRILATIVL